MATNIRWLPAESKVAYAGFRNPYAKISGGIVVFERNGLSAGMP
jgi:hypothetical protein